MARAVKVKYKSPADRISGAAVIALSIIIFMIILYPLWFVVIASISNSNLVNLGKVTFLPKDIRLYGYEQIMEDVRIWKGYANTILYVTAGTVLNLAITMPAAYALSRPDFKAREKVMFYFVFTMFSSGGFGRLFSLHLFPEGGDPLIEGGYAQSSADQVKYAVIIVSTLPILCVYPFVQKYFEKGVMIGAVKG